MEHVAEPSRPTFEPGEVMGKELEPSVIAVEDKFFSGRLHVDDDVGALGLRGEEVEDDIGEAGNRTGSQRFDTRQRHRRRLTVGDETCNGRRESEVEMREERGGRGYEEKTKRWTRGEEEERKKRK